jgi:flagellar protein FlbD
MLRALGSIRVSKRYFRINNLQCGPIQPCKGRTRVIELTRLNGTRLVLNSDLIQYVESSPDTTLTLINGEKVVVSESLEQVVELAILYRARLLGAAARECPGGLIVASGSAWRANSAHRAGCGHAEQF